MSAISEEKRAVSSKLTTVALGSGIATTFEITLTHLLYLRHEFATFF